MDLELTGKRALVTGGSRGIGKAIAFDLAREGCEVAISARDPGRLAAAAAEIGAEVGREIHWFSAEASDDASIKAMVAGAAAAMGGLDILVNNAASPGSVHGPKPLAELTDEIVMADINVKVMGYLRCHARGCALHAGRRLGPDHQHLRPRRTRQRQHGRQHPQRFGRRDHQESRRRAGPRRDQRDGRASGPDAD